VRLQHLLLQEQLFLQAVEIRIKKKLDIKVKYDVSKDYKVAVQRFANDEVHLMWFGGVTGAQARAKVEGSRAIAQGVIEEIRHFP